MTFDFSKIKVWSCGKDHGTIMFAGEVICPCGKPTITAEEYLKRQGEEIAEKAMKDVFKNGN